jgi:hypothetical protein
LSFLAYYFLLPTQSAPCKQWLPTLYPSVHLGTTLKSICWIPFPCK